MNKAENRKFPRFELERAVKIILSDGTLVDAKMNNISAQGIGILYPEATKIGTKLKIHFTIPIKNDLIPFNVDVCVCHVHLSGNNFQIGLQFEQMDKEHQVLLTQFIIKRMTVKKLSRKIVTANNLHK